MVSEMFIRGKMKWLLIDSVAVIMDRRQTLTGLGCVCVMGSHRDNTETDNP